ncbi:MAG: ABC transporter substrate-binding protein [Bifidobacteriaceae bacterium]|jgi:polar amino acid transport system substrate-binding protein|nr:ABC transporter substrate-binding protein [Bifidobacteriaceae bacterium]
MVTKNYILRLRKVIAAALMIMMIAGISACSVGKNAESVAENGAGFDFMAIQKDDAIADLLPIEVRESGVIQVGSDTTYSPFDFISEDNKITGIDIDIAKAMSRVLGVEIVFNTSIFDQIIPSIGAKYNAGFSALFVTDERIKQVDFVSYMQTASVVTAQKGNPSAVDPKNLCGKKIAVQTNTTEFQDAEAIGEKCVASGRDNVTILANDSQAQVTNYVATGRADVMFTEKAVAGYAIKLSDDKLEMLGEYGDDNYLLGIALKKGDSLAVPLQKALNVLIQSGDMDKILDTWGITNGSVTESKVIKTSADFEAASGN